MNLKIIPGEFSVCKIPDLTQVSLVDDFFFLCRTDEELSLVCREDSAPGNCADCERGWSMFRVEGVLDFSLTGILANLSGVLADAKVGIFAVSTYNTDYILVKTENLARAAEALRAAGHSIA
ncbi:MAG: ACT domain-containing protein [Lentisphaeria bacterium]|nr:ACT domain-containing protein [Lentisphaeria bacterium]